MAEIIEPDDPRPLRVKPTEPEGPPPAEPKPPLLDRIDPWMGSLVAALLFAIAAYFTAWFWVSNAGLWATPRFGGLFRWIGADWAVGVMDWRGLGWAAGSAAFLIVLGWFFLDALELYLPIGALAALALACGMGAAGVALEWIAMAHWLTRPVILTAMGLLLAGLWALGWRASNRPPESWGGGGEGGFLEQAMRRELERKAYRESIIYPTGAPAILFSGAAFALIALITLANFYHAVLFPETYWDSLILYLGYARMMFFERGIVQKVVGQVGIGLGANYPHLYSLLGAGTSVVANGWTELPQRLLAPMCGLGTILLVFHTTLRLTRNFNLALAGTLIYRSIPLGLAYDQYASDYALTILYSAALLYVALMYIETGLWGYFVLATALASFGMHINYLMGALWAPWGLMIIAAHWRMPTLEDVQALDRMEWRPPPRLSLLGTDPGIQEPPAWSFLAARLSLSKWIASPRVLLTIAGWGLLASTWLVRNKIVTGNPVYAFFYNIFGGIHINPDVMESAVKEWIANGAGIALFGDTSPERFLNAWTYFVSWKQGYRIQPFFTGFALAGGLIWMGRALAAPWIYRRNAPGPELVSRGGGNPGDSGEAGPTRFVDVGVRIGAVAFSLVALLLGYHIILAPYYLYQIIMILPALAVLSSYALPYWRRRGWRWAFGALTLAIGLVPGLAMSMMGWKVKRPAHVGANRNEGQTELFAFRHPLPEPRLMYHWEFGDDAVMWGLINEKLKGAKILTHENRHLVFDPSIELIQLDDWPIQQIWPLQPREKVRELRRLGIQYYLRTANEKNHSINAKMGTVDWERLGLMRPVAKYGENELYVLSE